MPPLTRRQFLGAAAAGSVGLPVLAGASLDDAPMPTRPFGRTGLTVPILGFGGGSRFLMYEEEEKALEALNTAINLGVTYLDTAHSYGDGTSEERIGRLMPDRRKDVILATKIPGRTADDARRQIELSLRRLHTDRLDVLHIHALRDADDLKAIEARGGVLEALYEARDQKIARAIGITGHADPAAMRDALERHDFDACQFALNAALARMAEGPGGMKATPMRAGGFEELALPVAVRKNLGVIAMKVFGQDQLVGAAPIEAMLRYSLSLPVSLASCGMPRLEFLRANAALARAFKPMPEAERRRLIDSIHADRKVAMAAFFGDHADA